MNTANNTEGRSKFHDTTVDGNKYRRRRRGSHDEKSIKPLQFLIDVEETAKLILAQEDTDGDFQITVNDSGPKVLKVGTANSGGYKKHDIRGTYMLSNLLQELALARDYGRRHILIDESRLSENPVDRLSRMIRHNFWQGLTRSIDADVLEVICNDPKNRSKNRKPLIYVPYNDEDAFTYYNEVAEERPHLELQVERLPKDITPSYVKSINHRPGILSLGLRPHVDAKTGKNTFRGIPFVVPGGRFNEMYGWDSYFEALGLIADGCVQLARDMVDNFVYQIRHYGKILNANRSYYLTRSQPPFLTDMALKVYGRLDQEDPSSKAWLATALRAAIKEYYTVWMAEPRFDSSTGLSCYHPTGIGMPPETESTHFNHVMEPYAAALGLDVEEYKQQYDDGRISEPKLDRYFVHDRAVRESGHDTTYRLEKKCADLATVDLNCLLYKYEIDIAETIRDVFSGHFPLEGYPEEGLDFPGMEPYETPAAWFERAAYRQYLIDTYCWDDATGLYYDYDVVHQRRSVYESVTALWVLWAGCAPVDKADRLVEACLSRFEVTGGLVCGTEASRGVISLERPNRQWDYPFGWAPHQIMAWQGLANYGYHDDARRLAYRWLYTITKSFVDFNGVVPEKFDIVSMTHQVKVEYGNVGVDFKFVPREGFGWMNASYQTGIAYLSNHMRRTLGTLTPPDQLFAHMRRNHSIHDALQGMQLDSTASPSEPDQAEDLTGKSLPSASMLVKMFAEISNPIASPSGSASPDLGSDEQMFDFSDAPISASPRNSFLAENGFEKFESKFISIHEGEVVCSQNPAEPLEGPFYHKHSHSEPSLN